MIAVFALLGCGWLLARSASSVAPSQPPAGFRSSCGVSIILVAVDGDMVSRAIDAASGRRGWSHAALDGCEVDEDGTPVGLDCYPGRGVQRRPISEIVGGLPFARIHLPLSEGAELYGCVRGRVGAPFDVVGLILGPAAHSTGFVCSQLIYDCLPMRLRDLVPKPRRRHVAPNDLAAAFGVTGPGEVWIS